MESRMVAAQAGERYAPTPTDDVRSGVWLLLATLLRVSPDVRMLEHLRNSIHPTEADDPLATAWQQLQRASSDASAEAIDAEFHALFIGLGRGELVPYASWYRAGFLMDRPLVDLRAELAALDLRRRDDNREPEDHAAALAETMALLTDPETGRDPAVQARLFHEHVDTWMPGFFADLQQTPTAVFYRAVGAVGQAFLEYERRFLGDATAA